MYRISIYKNEQVTNQATFPTREELDAWLNFHLEHETFGKAERTIQVLVSEEIPELREIQSVLVTPEARDPETDEVITEAVYEDQEVITQGYSPAVYEDQVIPAEYEVVIEDVTNQLALEKEKAEAQKFLNETDFKVLKYLRHQALGRTPSMTEEEYLQLEQQRQEAADKL